MTSETTKARVLGPLDTIVRQDIETVTAFILGYWPGYEDAISWGDDLDASDYDWYVAAQRLKDVLANADVHLSSERSERR